MSRRFQEVLGYGKEPQPFEAPPEMPGDLMEAYLEGLEEYGRGAPFEIFEDQEGNDGGAPFDIFEDQEGNDGGAPFDIFEDQDGNEVSRDEECTLPYGTNGGSVASGMRLSGSTLAYDDTPDGLQYPVPALRPPCSSRLRHFLRHAASVL
jgi:hypothetical protein